MAADVLPGAPMSSKNWTLVAAVLGSSIVFLDSAVLTVALPAIGHEPRLFLDVLEAQNYIQYGYLLTLSSLLILAGALSDFYGRRRMFIIGLVGFGGASLLCGLAPNLELLILARLVQGAAGALLVPGSLAILTNTFEGEEQGRAFGIWASATGLAPILGPFIGGVLVDNFSWRWIFLLNLPFTIVAIWAAVKYVKESRNEQASSHFDWVGAFLVAVAVGGLSFGTIYGQQRQWQDPLAFVALAIGGITTIALPFYFNWAKHPLVPLSMFRSRNFSVTNISTLLIYGALYVTFFYLPLFLQGTLGYSASAVGLGSIPGSLFLIFLSTRFGGLAARYGPRIFMTVGPLIMCVGLLWIARIPADSPAWQFEISNSIDVAALGRLLDRRAALLPDLWRGRVNHGRATDDGPDALRPGPPGRSCLCHQQRHITRRAAAGRCVDLHRHHRVVLRDVGVAGARPGHGLAAGPRGDPADQRARAVRPGRPGRRRPPGIYRFVPPGDAVGCSAAIRRGADQRTVHLEPSGPGGAVS